MSPAALRPTASAEASRTDGAAERLRADIDRGRTGDKVDFPDPAAAPLGADEEAAGTPLTPHAVRTAHAEELKGPPSPPLRTTGLGAAWLLIGVIVLLAVGLIGWMMIGR